MPNWNEDWPDSTNLHESRAAFVEREMARLKRSPDPFDEDFVERQRKALASANRYFEERDPRSLAQRLGYAEIAAEAPWTAGDDGAEE